MMLDIKTVMILYLLINIINIGAITVIWAQNRGRFKGVTFWLLGLALQAAGPVLLALRGLIPDIISMTGSNTMALVGILIIFMGLERFCGKKGWQIHNYVLLAIFITVSIYFVVFHPNLMARNIAVSAMIMIYTFQAGWLLLRRVDPGMRQITRFTGIVFAGFALLNFARIILTIIIPEQSNDFFNSGVVNSLAFTGYILLSICLTISLVLMVSRRLLADVKSQEDKFTTAFHSSPYAIILTRPSNGIIFEVNAGFVNISGYQYSEAVGKTTLDLKLWGNEEDRLAVVSELTQGREIREVEYQFRHRTGRLITGLFSANIFTVNNETCILSSIGDITERKKAEETSRESAERFMNMANLLPQAVFETDEKGNFTFVNRQGFEMFGYSDADVAAGMNVLETIIPQDRNRAVENISRRIKGEELLSQEYTAVKKDGSKFPAAIYASTIIFNSKYAGMRGMMIDLTERKLMENALKESEAQYRLLSEHMTDTVWLMDMQLKTTYQSPSAEKLRGYKPEEIMEMPPEKHVTPESLKLVFEVLSEEIPRVEANPDYNPIRTLDLEYYRKDGTTVWAESKFSVIRDESGKPVSILAEARDITDRKQLEEEQQRVAKLESVGLLAGGIAHDFNNILTAILGNISLASMEAAPGSELQNSLQQAEKASQRAKALTVQLLTFSKGGAPVLKLASLEELLKDTAGFALSGSKVKCHFFIPPDLWHAEVDAGQVSQVIHNLVINAQQAMPAGGSIEISAENIALSETQRLGRGLPLKSGDYVRIAITDHGIGIPKDHLEKIFDPFFTTKQKGNGMGLAISFSIARQHGGHISVESELGTGSTFYLYLPASTQTSAPKGDKKETIKPAGKARILVMDDERGVREIAGRMLKHIGYKDIEFALDGADAIKLYQAALKSGNPFTVAILDLTIPGGMGGQSAIRELLKIDPSVKAIVSSGYIDDPVMAKHRDYGFSGMVAKPYTIEELRKAVQDVIG